MSALDLGSAPSGIPVLDHLPDGCRLHLQDNGMHAPYLRPGEWAVVNTEAREIIMGELYLVEQSHGPIIWQVCPVPEWLVSQQTQPKRLTAYLHPLNRPRSHEEVEEMIALTPLMGELPLYLSDGPIFIDYLEEQIIGRVIGIYMTETLPMRKAQPVALIGGPGASAD